MRFYRRTADERELAGLIPVEADKEVFHGESLKWFSAATLKLASAKESPAQTKQLMRMMRILSKAKESDIRNKRLNFEIFRHRRSSSRKSKTR